MFEALYQTTERKFHVKVDVSMLLANPQSLFLAVELLRLFAEYFLA